MSAPGNAKPLGTGGWDNEDGTIMTDKEVKKIKVVCQCGWKGHAGQLLGVDDEDTLWCPRCRTIGWEYA
jgi:hypothetical protein